MSALASIPHLRAHLAATQRVYTWNTQLLADRYIWKNNKCYVITGQSPITKRTSKHIFIDTACEIRRE